MKVRMLEHQCVYLCLISEIVSLSVLSVLGLEYAGLKPVQQSSVVAIVTQRTCGTAIRQRPRLLARRAASCTWAPSRTASVPHGPSDISCR